MSNNQDAIKAIKTCDKKHMAALIEKLMYSFCRETTAHVPFQIVVKKNASASQKRHRNLGKEHNAGSGALARPRDLYQLGFFCITSELIIV